jgi:hypothetical protein
LPAQQASSAAAGKKAAERFLITRADGFSPPTSLVREELHARAQKLAKAAGDRTCVRRMDDTGHFQRRRAEALQHAIGT